MSYYWNQQNTWWELPCNVCGVYIPYDLALCKDGRCINCDMSHYFNSIAAQKYPGKKVCQHCYTPLRPVGNRRSNGASHDDWDSRNLHKKCWIAIKNKEESSRRVAKRFNRQGTLK